MLRREKMNNIDDIRNYLNLVEYSNHYKPVEEVIEQPLSNNIYSLIDAMRELREEGALMNEYVAESIIEEDQVMSPEKTLDYLRSVMDDDIDNEDHGHWRNHVLEIGRAHV